MKTFFITIGGVMFCWPLFYLFRLAGVELEWLWFLLGVAFSGIGLAVIAEFTFRSEKMGEGDGA